MNFERNRDRAFTLVEMLITIGIIVLLIGILIPVVNRVRTAAKEADVRNQLSVIAGAIKMYEMEFRAYPGPLSNDEIIGLVTPNVLGVTPADDNITMSENLVLALLGGLFLNPSDEIEFDWQRVGQGASNVGIGAPPKKYKTYIESNNLTWSRPGFSPGAGTGAFRDDAGTALDTNIPEFVDRFTDPLPILYLRARVGADGVMSDGADFQYDLQQIVAYTSSPIGVGRENIDHGLQALDGMDDAPSAEGLYGALSYFKHPTLNPTGTANADGTPREKDSYILISAGKDRVYGTKDDICNFGGVEQ